MLIGSIVMLFICLTYNLKSLKLGVLCFLLEILCITSSQCIYRGLLKVNYTSLESLALEVMVSAGISTIYIFLIFDAWNQSSLFRSFFYDSKGFRNVISVILQKRTAYVWLRCIPQIKASSIPCFIILLGNKLIPLMPVKALAIQLSISFLTSTIILVITIPALLIQHEKNLIEQ